MTAPHLTDEQVFDAVDGELEAAHARHLDSCSACAGRVRELIIEKANQK